MLRLIVEQFRLTSGGDLPADVKHHIVAAQRRALPIKQVAKGIERRRPQRHEEDGRYRAEHAPQGQAIASRWRNIVHPQLYARHGPPKMPWRCFPSATA